MTMSRLRRLIQALPLNTSVDSKVSTPLPVIVPEYAATSTGQLTLF